MACPTFSRSSSTTSTITPNSVLNGSQMTMTPEAVSEMALLCRTVATELQQDHFYDYPLLLSEQRQTLKRKNVRARTESDSESSASHANVCLEKKRKRKRQRQRKRNRQQPKGKRTLSESSCPLLEEEAEAHHFLQCQQQQQQQSPCTNAVVAHLHPNHVSTSPSTSSALSSSSSSCNDDNDNDDGKQDRPRAPSRRPRSNTVCGSNPASRRRPRSKKSKHSITRRTRCHSMDNGGDTEEDGRGGDFDRDEDDDADNDADDDDDDDADVDLDPATLLQRARSRILDDLTFLEDEQIALPHHLPKYKEKYNKDGNVGVYSTEERAALLNRFHKKRTKRNWNKTIRYDVRKNTADRRLRIKGRFVKKEVRDLLALSKNDWNVTSNENATTAITTTTTQPTQNSSDDSSLSSSPYASPKLSLKTAQVEESEVARALLAFSPHARVDVDTSLADDVCDNVDTVDTVDIADEKHSHQQQEHDPISLPCCSTSSSSSTRTALPLKTQDPEYQVHGSNGNGNGNEGSSMDSSSATATTALDIGETGVGENTERNISTGASVLENMGMCTSAIELSTTAAAATKAAQDLVRMHVSAA